MSKNKIKLFFPILFSFALFALGVFLVNFAPVKEFLKSRSLLDLSFKEKSSEMGLIVSKSERRVIIELAKETVPSVVNISTFFRDKKKSGKTTDDFMMQFWEHFFKEKGYVPPHMNDKPILSLGSGFIVDSSGLILTNLHVIGEANEIKITFTEDELEIPTDGHVVGRDPELDLALIRVKTDRPLKEVKFGNSDYVEVGEFVVAIGNPFGHGHSVTHGIVSAMGRDAPEFPLARYFQTDAPINPGNSGGPLVNMQGEVVGVNSAIDIRAQGIGYALPINQVLHVLSELKETGSVKRGFLGLNVNYSEPSVAKTLGLPKDRQAPIVVNVEPGSPADEAEIQPYDFVLEYDGKAVTKPRELKNMIASTKAGKEVSIKILRKKEEKIINVKVVELQNEDAYFEDKKEDKNLGIGNELTDELGLKIKDLSAKLSKEYQVTKAQGVVVTHVEEESPSDVAGLLKGDLIVEVNQKVIKSSQSFFESIKDQKNLLFRIKRMGTTGQPVYLVLALEAE